MSVVRFLILNINKQTAILFKGLLKSMLSFFYFPFMMSFQLMSYNLSFLYELNKSYSVMEYFCYLTQKNFQSYGKDFCILEILQHDSPFIFYSQNLRDQLQHVFQIFEEIDQNMRLSLIFFEKCRIKIILNQNIGDLSLKQFLKNHYFQLKYFLSIHLKMVEAVQKRKVIKKGQERQIRLWVKAKFSGFRRSKVAQNTNQNILSLEGVNDRNAAQYYYGKRVAYIYKRTSGQKDKRFKTIWGRISRSHGNNGSVLARFNKNLPARAMGSTLRVMLFPQRG